MAAITDLEKARRTGLQGFWAALIVAVLTTILALVAHFAHVQELPVNLWALVDAAVFGLIAGGIWRMSRLAAVAGLALYLTEQAVTQMTFRYRPNIIVIVVICLAFVNSIRGTFAYHRIRKQQEQDVQRLAAGGTV